MNLTPRKLKILNTIIKYYLEYGEPVGSKLIASEIGVSSATVRNEMAELTEIGFLEQPHTSAGRIPSGMGFRAYINESENKRKIASEQKKRFDFEFSSSDPEQLLYKVAEILSEKYACIISKPGDNSSRIKAIQFVQISRRRAVLILLSSVGTVVSRVFKCEFDLNQDMLRVFFRAFNKKLMGIELSVVTPAFLQSFAVSLGEVSALMTNAILAFYEAVKETVKTEIIVRGEANLYVQNHLSQESLSDISGLISDSSLLRETFMNLPTRISVLLGGENMFYNLRDTGIVSAKYFISGKCEGVIAIVGPIRMDYPKIISELEYAADYIGESFTEFINEDA